MTCDRDCFNCQYPDCICDDMTYEDWREDLEEYIAPKTAAQKRIAANKAKYYAENKERIADYQAKYRAENKERIAANAAKYYAENKERIAANAAKYRAENKERIAANKAKYYAENKERIAANAAKYYAENKERIAANKAKYYAENKERIARKARRNELKHRLDEHNAALGLALRQARKDKGLTQGALAALAGLDASSICKYERGRIPFDPGIFDGILEVRA